MLLTKAWCTACATCTVTCVFTREFLTAPLVLFAVFEGSRFAFITGRQRPSLEELHDHGLWFSDHRHPITVADHGQVISTHNAHPLTAARLVGAKCRVLFLYELWSFQQQMYSIRHNSEWNTSFLGSTNILRIYSYFLRFFEHIDVFAEVRAPIKRIICRI